MYSTTRIFIVIVTGLGLIWSEAAMAAVIAGPLTRPGSNHTYYLLDQSLFWTQAEAEAISLGGHLVTINDAAENEWIRTTMPTFGPHNMWIGLNDTAVEGTFEWVSGEPVTYTNWKAGEPNGTSDVVGMTFSDGLWEDVAWGSVRGVVEVAPAPPGVSLLVSSQVTDSVLRYDGLTGAFIDAFVPTGSGGLNFPNGLVFGPDGNLYVASTNTNSILRYDGASGAFIDAFVPTGSGGLSAPFGLVFGPDRNLYVVSQGTNSVLRYDGQSGAFMDAFVPSGSGGLAAPFGVVYGPDGNMYVASPGNTRVLRFDAQTGAFIDAFVPLVGGGGSGGPRGLIFGFDGNLYLTAANFVARYDGQTGAQIDLFANSSTGLDSPQGLVFGPDGSLYTPNINPNNVLRFNGQTGALIDHFVPGDSGGLDTPRFLIFDNDSDFDGVADASDNCPFVANTDQADSDGDGVGNTCDGCPNDINKTVPGVCGCGAPDTDTDGDGTPDCLDGCPNDSNQTEACCLPNGTCQDATVLSCTIDLSGTPLGTCTACQGDNNGDGFDDLCVSPILISEYYEAAGGTRKCIELFNRGTVDFDLGANGYRIASYTFTGTVTNRVTDARGIYTFGTLGSEVVPAGGVFVICAVDNADGIPIDLLLPFTCAPCAFTGGGDSPIASFNGEDEVVLFGPDTSTPLDNVIDVFGVPGQGINGPRSNGAGGAGNGPYTHAAWERNFSVTRGVTDFNGFDACDFDGEKNSVLVDPPPFTPAGDAACLAQADAPHANEWLFEGRNEGGVIDKHTLGSHVADAPGNDCNANGIPDATDISNGTSNDCNANGIPDECDTCGDLDGDGDVGGQDFAIFLAAFGHGTGDPTFAPCADFDADGLVTLVDYQAWIQCYRAFLANPLAAPPIPGDVGDMNADGIINGLDIQEFVDAIIAQNGAGFRQYLVADINGDGALDMSDMGEFTGLLLSQQ